MSALDQWASYNNKLKNKVNEMFTSKKEGFSGILGANGDMDLVNTNERMDTQTNVGQLTQNIKTYQAAETNLQAKTNQYLNLNMNREPGVGAEKRNYNVFINKPAPVTQTVSGATVAKVGQVTNTGPQCISLNSLSTFVDSSDNGFDAAYPDNFTAFEKAKTACQTWAADLGFSFSGITKEQGQYRCYISQTPPESAPPYTKPGVLYTVAVNPNTTNGGLFSNGQIGVFRSTKNMRWNIQNMAQVIYIRKYNDDNYSIGPAPMQNAVKENWWAASSKKADMFRNKSGWGMNLFPDDTMAWWVGYSKGDNSITKNSSNKQGGEVGVDGTTSYFYYVYNSTGAATPDQSFTKKCPGWTCTPGPTQNTASCPGKVENWNGKPLTCVNNVVNNNKSPTTSGQIVGIYLIKWTEAAHNNLREWGGVLKINGIDIICTIDDPALTTPNPFNLTNMGGFNSVYTLAPGKNVFEINSQTGLPKGGWCMYVYDLLTKKILFRSGDPGWGVTTAPAPDWSMVSNIPETPQLIADPYLFKTVNNEPNGFSTCDKLVGGSINTKTINATYGKNCSTSTKKPLQVRYISIYANNAGDPVQISQLVVMAFLNGVEQNVANRGTITNSPSENNLDPSIPVNGKTDNKLYWSSAKSQAVSTILNGVGFWYLDLGAEYPLTSITFYNRPDFNWYADGMTIGLGNDKKTPYTLKNPIKLTGQLVQKFNVSEDDIFIASPFYMNGPPDFKVAEINRIPGTVWFYGFSSLADAETTCSARGQRVCRKDELINYDVMDHGVGFTILPDNSIGLPNKHHRYVLDGPGGDPRDWLDFGQFNPAIHRTGVACCDKNHVGAYDAVINPMTTAFYA